MGVVVIVTVDDVVYATRGVSTLSTLEIAAIIDEAGVVNAVNDLVATYCCCLCYC